MLSTQAARITLADALYRYAQQLTSGKRGAGQEAVRTKHFVRLIPLRTFTASTDLVLRILRQPARSHALPPLQVRLNGEQLECYQSLLATPTTIRC